MKVNLSEKELKFVKSGLTRERYVWDTHLENVSYGKYKNDSIFFTKEEVTTLLKKFGMDMSYDN